MVVDTIKDNYIIIGKQYRYVCVRNYEKNIHRSKYVKLPSYNITTSGKNILSFRAWRVKM